MKRICLGLFLLLCETMAFGQTIQRITLEMQQDNEPPTIPGPALYRIDFQKSATGDFVATHYFENRKKKKLTTQVVLEKDRVATVFQWIQQNQKEFPLSAMNITRAELLERSKSQDLHFEIPNDLLLRVDSFAFCQDYRTRVRMATGGSWLKYALMDDLGKEVSFEIEESTIETKNFNLQHYLFGYFLLNGKVPAAFSNLDLFLKSVTLDVLMDYFRILECEGYYYKEFREKHPKRTAAENNTKAGWNFVEYMKQRK